MFDPDVSFGNEMLPISERRSIAALHALRKFAGRYMSIGKHLRLNEEFLETLEKRNEMKIVKFHQILHVYLLKTQREEDHKKLEHEMIDAIEKRTMCPFTDNLKDLLDLGE